MKLKSVLLSLLTPMVLAATANAQLIFTQYYEGASNNKYLELKNIGDTAIDLSLYTLSVYSNANAEAWKSGTATTTTSGTLTLSGMLEAGAVYLIGNTSVALPTYAVTAANLLTSSATNFNGNDSITLWTGGSTYSSTSQLVDVLSFTNTGNEGQDKSFVRLTADIGWNLTASSNITQFPTVWTVATLDDVANATAGTNNYLSTSTVTAVPEPGTVALIGLGLGTVLWGVRRKRA